MKSLTQFPKLSLNLPLVVVAPAAVDEAVNVEEENEVVVDEETVEEETGEEVREEEEAGEVEEGAILLEASEDSKNKKKSKIIMRDLNLSQNVCEGSKS